MKPGSRGHLMVTSAGVERTLLRAINRIPLGYHRGVYICGLQTQPPPVSVWCNVCSAGMLTGPGWLLKEP